MIKRFTNEQPVFLLNVALILDSLKFSSHSISPIHSTL